MAVSLEILFYRIADTSGSGVEWSIACDSSVKNRLNSEGQGTDKFPPPTIFCLLFLVSNQQSQYSVFHEIVLAESNLQTVERDESPPARRSPIPYFRSDEGP
jgi:hypothetical protein